MKILSNCTLIENETYYILKDCYTTISGHFFTICTYVIFHKTEVQTVILRCLMSLNLDWLKNYGLRCSQRPRSCSWGRYNYYWNYLWGWNSTTQLKLFCIRKFQGTKRFQSIEYLFKVMSRRKNSHNNKKQQQLFTQIIIYIAVYCSCLKFVFFKKTCTFLIFG